VSRKRTNGIRWIESRRKLEAKPRIKLRRRRLFDRGRNVRWPKSYGPLKETASNRNKRKRREQVERGYGEFV
jgi:hypothetical protein